MAMRRKVLRSKIHRATVTHADLNYEGSVTIPPELMKSADINQYEAVHIWNVTRGTRLETYAITGEPNSTDICINGAAAHLMGVGDKVIIACFVEIDQADLATHKPLLVFVNENNRQMPTREEVPGPKVVGISI
jgi:aspartate 1-decarboxylase